MVLCEHTLTVIDRTVGITITPINDNPVQSDPLNREATEDVLTL